MPTAGEHPSSEALNRSIRKQPQTNQPEKPSTDLGILSPIIKMLVIIAGCASIMPGFFAIPKFIASVAAIPGFSGLLLIPSAVITATVLWNAAAIWRVEQKVFEPNFIRLIKQILAVPGFEGSDANTRKAIKRNNQHKALLEKEKIRAQQALAISQEEKERYSQFLASLNKFNDESKQQNIVIRAIYQLLATSIASCMLGLRIIVSVGSAMMGMQAFSLAICGLFGITTLPFIEVLIPLFAVAGTILYFSKNAQNVVDQFNQVRNFIGYFFGIITYTKAHHEKTIADELLLLKNIYRMHNSQKLKTKKAADYQYKLLPGWKKVIWSISSFGFYTGIVAGCFQSFFSIDKFVNNMGKVSFLSFFNKISPEMITAAALVSAAYTIFENSVLKQYFDKLVGNILATNRKPLAVNIPGKEFQLYDKALKSLLPSDYTICSTGIYNSSEQPMIITITFKDKLSYKIFRLNQKIEDIYNQKIMQDAGYTRSSKNQVEIAHQNVSGKYNSAWYVVAYAGTVYTLFLRAVVSIGPSLLGLTAATDKCTSRFFGFKLGTEKNMIGLPPLIYQYMTRCSQNIVSQFRTCMERMFGIDIKNDPKVIKEGIEKELRKERLEALNKYTNVITDKHTNYNAVPADKHGVKTIGYARRAKINEPKSIYSESLRYTPESNSPRI